MKELNDIIFKSPEGIECKPQDFVIKDGYLSKYIGNDATVVIPENVNTIESGAFSGADSIRSLYIPENVRVIEQDCFSGLTSLRAVRIVAELESLGAGAFKNCKKLYRVKLDGVIDTIPEAAFWGCSALSSVEIFRVRVIGKNAFHGCTSLSSINLPEGLLRIGVGGFSGCTELERVTLPAGLETVGSGAFSGCAIRSIDIPETVTNLNSDSFLGCPITAGSIPERFYDCFGEEFLKNRLFKIQDNVITAYYGNRTSLSIPEGILEIAPEVFRDHSELIELRLPSSLGIIGKNAFRGCVKLERLYISATHCSIHKDAFRGAPADPYDKKKIKEERLAAKEAAKAEKAAEKNAKEAEKAIAQQEKQANKKSKKIEKNLARQEKKAEKAARRQARAADRRSRKSGAVGIGVNNRRFYDSKVLEILFPIGLLPRLIYDIVLFGLSLICFFTDMPLWTIIAASGLVLLICIGRNARIIAKISHLGKYCSYPSVYHNLYEAIPPLFLIGISLIKLLNLTRIPASILIGIVVGIAFIILSSVLYFAKHDTVQLTMFSGMLCVMVYVCSGIDMYWCADAIGWTVAACVTGVLAIISFIKHTNFETVGRSIYISIVAVALLATVFISLYRAFVVFGISSSDGYSVYSNSAYFHNTQDPEDNLITRPEGVFNLKKVIRPEATTLYINSGYATMSAGALAGCPSAEIIMLPSSLVEVNFNSFFGGGAFESLPEEKAAAMPRELYIGYGIGGIEDNPSSLKVMTYSRSLFGADVRIPDIYYNGTVEAFKKIKRVGDWDYYYQAGLTVYCTDGILTIHDLMDVKAYEKYYFTGGTSYDSRLSSLYGTIEDAKAIYASSYMTTLNFDSLMRDEFGGFFAAPPYRDIKVLYIGYNPDGTKSETSSALKEIQYTYSKFSTIPHIATICYNGTMADFGNIKMSDDFRERYLTDGCTVICNDGTIYYKSSLINDWTVPPWLALFLGIGLALALFAIPTDVLTDHKGISILVLLLSTAAFIFLSHTYTTILLMSLLFYVYAFFALTTVLSD